MGRSSPLGSSGALEIAARAPLGSAGALEMAARARSARLGRSKWAARARSAPLGRSKWPLELARLGQGARNCSAWLLENSAPADVSDFEPARLGWGARHGRSNSLGSARALEMAARTRSNSLELARLLQDARNRSAWLLENTAPAYVSEFDAARLHWGARHWRSSPLGSAGAPEIAARARSAPLDRRRFTGQDHECLLHSTQRRTFSCMECTGPP